VEETFQILKIISEVGDPEDLLAKVTNVESAREQRSASQKKADKKVASKVKKSAAAAAAAAAKEMADNAKKAVVTEPTVKRECKYFDKSIRISPYL
jgi:peptidoglycan hydrolase CwlO-like protein